MATKTKTRKAWEPLTEIAVLSDGLFESDPDTVRLYRISDDRAVWVDSDGDECRIDLDKLTGMLPPENVEVVVDADDIYDPIQQLAFADISPDDARSYERAGHVAFFRWKGKRTVQVAFQAPCGQVLIAPLDRWQKFIEALSALPTRKGRR